MNRKIKILIPVILMAIALTFSTLYSKPHAATVTCPTCGSTNVTSMGITKSATCTETGSEAYRCNQSDTCPQFNVTIPALGHHYVKTDHKDATCTADGYDTYTCDRIGTNSIVPCGNKKTTKIPALGHDYVETVIQEADCELDGIKEFRCSRCDDNYQETTPAFGHDFGEFTIIKQPTCEEAGTQEAVCNTCQKNITEEIPALGHSYSSDWIIDKEPTQFSAGHKYKECEQCHERIEESIDKLPIDTKTVIIAAVTAVTVIAGGAVFTIKKNAKKKFELTLKEPASKKLLTYITDEDLPKFMKTKTFLKVIEKPYEELDKLYDTVKDKSPDLAVIEVNDMQQLEKVFELAEKFDDDVSADIGLVVNSEIVKDCKEKLKQYQKDKKLLSWVESDSHNEIKVLNLIAKLYKFDIKDDDDLGKIGKLADFLQIPYVSKVIDVYTTGKGLKEDLEAEDKGFTDYSTIVGDLASILGLEKVEKVTDFIDSVDTLKSNIKKEGGAYEVKKVYKSGSDIVDTIKDVIDKDD